MHRIDTTAGSPGPFAPPMDWEGAAEAYRALLRRRYRADPAARQQMAVVARHADDVQVTGPWAVHALDVIEKLSSRSAAA